MVTEQPSVHKCGQNKGQNRDFLKCVKNDDMSTATLIIFCWSTAENCRMKAPSIKEDTSPHHTDSFPISPEGRISRVSPLGPHSSGTGSTPLEMEQ